MTKLEELERESEDLKQQVKELQNQVKFLTAGVDGLVYKLLRKGVLE